jgi:putative AlgH/UPF0301 family transcriptional regulator
MAILERTVSDGHARAGRPNFYQSVTCLSEHNPKGAMGIVITRVHPEINGKMIFDELQIETAADARNSRSTSADRSI